MKLAANNKWSFYSFLLCAALMLYASFCFYPRWTKSDTESVLSFDVAGYYWYLPSIFIYHDLKHQGFKDSVMNKYQPLDGFQQGVQLPDGNWVMKYSSGMAVMYSPFFAAAHLLAGALGYPRDGFSPPYQLSIQIGAMLITLLGLWYLRKVLLLFYRDAVVATVLFILVFCTNYLNTAAIDVGMSHGWLFTVYVFLLYNTYLFYETGKTKHAVVIGLLVGLATLTRPSDIISCLIPLLWGLESIRPQAIIDHITQLLKRWKPLLIAVACAAPVISIQLFYWKYASGHWFTYSYGDQHLFFLHPNFMKYTFSPRSGWLLFSPMMIFAFVGLLPFLRSGKNKVAITTFFLLNYYIVCAWCIWWFGGRAMVQSYPVLMFPMASMVELVFSRKALALMVAPITIVFFYMNIWITINYHYFNLYDATVMTKAYLWKVVGRYHVPEYTTFLKDNTEMFEGTEVNKKLLWQNDFETDTTSFCKKTGKDSSRVLQLDATSREMVVYKFPAPAGSGRWLSATADFYCPVREWDTWTMTQFVLRAKKDGKTVKENMLRLQRLLWDGDRKNIPIYMDTRNIAYDTIELDFWNAYGNKLLIVDNAKIYSFDEKN